MKSTSKEIFSRNLYRVPLIAILRGVTPETVLPVCQILAEGGIRMVEVTMNSPSALESIRLLTREYDPEDLLVGAGTVLSPAEVDAVADAGGQYIISPNTDVSVIRQTRMRELISIPGFFTPTEAFSALQAGADYLKCFPARSLGMKYFNDLKAVVRAPLLAVGGIDLKNVSEWCRFADGVGIGSGLYKPGKDLDAIRNDARQYVQTVARAEGSK